MSKNTLNRNTEEVEEVKELEKFNELMSEAAKLSAEKRKLVAVYTQGVLAMASMAEQPEPKKSA